MLDSLNLEPGTIFLHVDKSDFILSVVVDTTIFKQSPFVLRGNPVNDKLRQGDMCTQEGKLLVRAKFPHRSWDKFIWIDYPNDALWEKHRQAKQEIIIEEHDKITGEIGIGVPKGTDDIIDLGMNWPLGCISLKTKTLMIFIP